jgi:hypothetical protein
MGDNVLWYLFDTDNASFAPYRSLPHRVNVLGQVFVSPMHVRMLTVEFQRLKNAMDNEQFDAATPMVALRTSTAIMNALRQVVVAIRAARAPPEGSIDTFSPQTSSNTILLFLRTQRLKVYQANHDASIVTLLGQADHPRGGSREAGGRNEVRQCSAEWYNDIE